MVGSGFQIPDIQRKDPDPKIIILVLEVGTLLCGNKFLFLYLGVVCLVCPGLCGMNYEPLVYEDAEGGQLLSSRRLRRDSQAGFRIRIRIGSVFAELLDPDSNLNMDPDPRVQIGFNLILRIN